MSLCSDIEISLEESGRPIRTTVLISDSLMKAKRFIPLEFCLQKVDWYRKDHHSWHMLVRFLVACTLVSIGILCEDVIGMNIRKNNIFGRGVELTISTYALDGSTKAVSLNFSNYSIFSTIH
jgi:hypothetical protein